MDIALIVAAVVIVPWLLFRNPRTYKIVMGFILMLAAIPAGIATELGVNGCCGSSRTQYTGIGIVLMALMIFGGLVLVVWGIRTQKR